MANVEVSFDPEETRVSKSHLGFPVVGIGASAGGLSALQRLFSDMPAHTGMAFVVVMHLSPDHESSLGAILQRSCELRVVTVEESTLIEADHVYVIAPARKLAMSDGMLRVSDLHTIEGRRGSIDLFFRSLAQAHWERAVGMVLSGTGSDGAQGLKRLKELGGVCIAQSPDDAEFDGMPRAAIATRMVDFVLPVAEMPAKLVDLWENARRIELPAPPSALEVRVAAAEAEQFAEEALVSIKALLRERTGHDFARYKRATVLRRLERRMQVNAMPDLPSYRKFLEREPAETQALLQDMLISVTNFFRDPEAFAALEGALRIGSVERRPGEPFRAWVVGCATGEEAYSVAILLNEVMGASGTPIQVFASDIDARAIAGARTGVYPASIATDVSADRLARYFSDDPAGYRIAKPTRDSVVFSAHNALSDPPFSRMDLICCRNVLIYLDRPAQAQLLRAFRFALRPRGLLFLGGSETADAADGQFVAEDKRHRLYRAGDSVARSPELPLPPASSLVHAAMAPVAATVQAPESALDALHRRVVGTHGPATVLVDADDTAIHVDERLAHLLRLPTGAPTNKLTALARPELRAELRAALARAAATGSSIQARRVRLTVNGASRVVAISVKPVSDETPTGLFLVLFDEASEDMGVGPEGVPARDPVVHALEARLGMAEEQLRSTRGESAASTEELRASNEELQTINEELRSTTEELETSREELQSVNEELSTVNGELNLKIEETAQANDDLQNLIISAEIGTVFVDREKRIKRFTPQAATLFNLLPSDVGRPLFDVTHRLDYPAMASDVEEVLRDLRRVEREVRSIDGRSLLVRVLPYRSADDRIDGAVLTFFDVSSLRRAEEQLRLSEQRMRLVAESMRDYAIVTVSASGAIATWSVGAERVFGYTAEEAVGQPFDLIFTPEDRRGGVPAEEMRLARETGRAPDDRWHMRKTGERIFCSGITTPLIDGGLVGYAKIARDFTETELRDRRREADLAEERAGRDALRKAATMKDEILAVVSHELKNPLSVIHMSAQLLTRLPGFQAEPRAERAAAAIKSAVASQVQIINDLLELSRANAGKIVLALESVDLRLLIQNIVDAVRTDIGSKRQVLDVDLEGPTVVVADPIRVEQIVWNLLTNAAKFTPQGGHIQVTLRVVGDRARISVVDSGIGIDPSHLSEVFEMFRQVESGPSRRRGGLGIGLALVRQLAELHGGEVSAASEGAGRGATFDVWLPIASTATAVSKAAQAYSKRGLNGLRILLVDDEPLLLDTFSDLLRMEGAQVVSVSSAVAALEMARAEPFDVVVSDVAMPERDGYWLVTQLRGTQETSQLPAVAVSGMGRRADRDRAIEAGFDAHVGKPLDLEALKIEIEYAIAQRSDSAFKDAPGDMQ